MSVLRVTLLCLGFVLCAGEALCAENYPTKPVRLLTAEPGGGNDFGARVIAQGLTGRLGQQVIVDNRLSGVILGNILAKATPDGYTIVYYGKAMWIAPLLQPAQYDVLKDIAPVSLVGKSPMIVVVHPSVPVNSIKELVALAKAKPGQLNYSSESAGAPSYLAGELFKAMTGTDIVCVPYKGSGAALNSIIGAETQLAFGTAASVTPHVKSGRLRGLAITSLKPSAIFPGLPTVAETVPGYEAGSTYAIFAPAKTPAPLIERLNREIANVLANAEVKERFFRTGVETTGGSPAELSAAIKSELFLAQKVIKAAGIRAQ